MFPVVACLACVVAPEYYPPPAQPPFQELHRLQQLAQVNEMLARDQQRYLMYLRSRSPHAGQLLDSCETSLKRLLIMQKRYIDDAPAPPRKVSWLTYIPL